MYIYIYVCVCVCIYSFIYLFIYLSIYLSIYLFIYIIYLFIYLFIYSFISILIYLFIHSFIYLFIYLFIYVIYCLLISYHHVFIYTTSSNDIIPPIVHRGSWSPASASPTCAILVCCDVPEEQIAILVELNQTANFGQSDQAPGFPTTTDHLIHSD